MKKSLGSVAQRVVQPVLEAFEDGLYQRPEVGFDPLPIRLLFRADTREEIMGVRHGGVGRLRTLRDRATVRLEAVLDAEQKEKLHRLRQGRIDFEPPR